jgi:hypothetical protein
MGLADIFSGGADSEAADILSKQLAQLNQLKTPTAQQLTLPELEKYVAAGILTPEQAQAYTVQNNAFDTVTAGGSGMDAELAAIGQLQNIVNSGGADAEEQANIQGILNTLGTTERGANEAIVNQNARQGIANSGLTMAAKLQAEQDAATNANMNALQTGASEEARNLAAIQGLGSAGSAVQGQEYTAGANKASAANAIAQFNAQQNQDISKLNTTQANAAKAANLANAQDVSNKNTQTGQMQEESIPAAQQQAYEDALQKASAGSALAEAAAGQKMQEGQQNAGTLGGILGTAGQLGAAYLTGNPYAALAAAMSSNSGTPNTNVSTSNGNNFTGMVASGGRITPGGVDRPLNMKAGGPVPGEAMVPGDSPANDTQLAKLSPGEIVLPRSVTQSGPQPGGTAGPDPSKVMEFLKSLPKPQARSSIHPKAVLDTLRGLSMHHAGVA